MRLEEARFDTGEVSINYAEGPSTGPPFVLLHGGAGRWQYGQAFLDLVAEDWHVYAPDFRGHGKSGRRPNAYQLIDYVRDTAAFLSNVVGEPAVVFGHSLGGEVAVKTASIQVESFRALIVGDAPLSTRNLATEEPTHRAQNVLWQRLAGRGVDEIVPALKDMAVRVPGQSEPQPARSVFGEDHPWFRHQALSLHQLDPDMLAAVLEGPVHMLGEYEPEVLLPPITCPVLLLQADPVQGAALQADEAEQALRLLPHATHVRLEAIGHPLHGSHPHQVLDAIRPFLNEVRARRGCRVG